MAKKADAAENQRAVFGGNSEVGEELRTILERIERVNEEIGGLQGDKKDIMSEAKGRGFDLKTIKTLLAMRKKDHSERQEEEATLELYMQALGMV